jgi:lysophospholipase L1-like esterase
MTSSVAIFPGQILTAQTLAAIIGSGGGGISYVPNDVRNFIGAGNTLDNTGATDMSALIETAHNNAQAAGFRTMWFPPGNYLAATLNSVGNVIFMGPGVLVGAYRKRITPENTFVGVPSRFDIQPAHRKRFDQAVAAATPSNPAVVVLFGDSTTDGGSPTSDIDTPKFILQQMFRQIYGPAAQNILIFHRGIGGQTWTTANVVGNAIPNIINHNVGSWFTNYANLWLSYIVAVLCPDAVTRPPDLVLCNFGMNDAQNFDYTQMLAALAYIIANTAQRFSLPPDLWFLTNYNPSLMDSNFNTQADQEGRDFVAGFTRTYAQSQGYGLLDRHRIACMAKDGFDPRKSNILDVSDTSGTLLPYSMPQQCTDFGFFITLPATPLTQLWNLGQMIITLSSKPGNTLVLDCDSTTNNLAVTVYRATGDVQIARTVSAFNCTTGGNGLYINACGPQIIVGCGPEFSFEQVVPEFWLPPIWAHRHGGLFTPNISMSGGPGTAGLVVRGRAGVFASTMPIIVDYEQFGVTGQSVTGYGGDGQNHMSSLGFGAIDVPTYEASQF